MSRSGVLRSTRGRVTAAALMALLALAVVAVTSTPDSLGPDGQETRAGRDSAGAGSASEDAGSSAVSEPVATGPGDPAAGASGSGAGAGSAGVAAASAATRPCPGTGGDDLVCGGTEVPAEVRVEGANGLKDGQEVTVRVEAREGAQIYGFEARLCAEDARFGSNALFNPTQTGKCVTKPLSDVSDDYIEVRSQPPHRVAEGTFRVGVGTEDSRRGDGSSLNVTCGPDPCQLILKIQHTKGYGFKGFPLAYRR